MALLRPSKVVSRGKISAAERTRRVRGQASAPLQTAAAAAASYGIATYALGHAVPIFAAISAVIVFGRRPRAGAEAGPRGHGRSGGRRHDRRCIGAGDRHGDPPDRPDRGAGHGGGGVRGGGTRAHDPGRGVGLDVKDDEDGTGDKTRSLALEAVRLATDLVERPEVLALGSLVAQVRLTASDILRGSGMTLAGAHEALDEAAGLER